MELAPWQQDHKEVIHQFLKQMNTVSSSFILKGGTALMECYGLDRFSEDIDITIDEAISQGQKKKVKEILALCQMLGRDPSGARPNTVFGRI